MSESTVIDPVTVPLWVRFWPMIITLLLIGMISIIAYCIVLLIKTNRKKRNS